ncbi:hypothetical protein AB0J80_08590 [Actinoplanes sp. NPDC049548]|uniref:hypothetical protein n=1 Tax=Actinoplanes sp. NPDC049548 TaxID=3155152 RepID=UPI00342DE37B
MTRARSWMLAVVALVAAWSMLTTTGTSQAAFVVRSASGSNALTTATLDPPGSFSANRPCTPLGPGYRDSTTNSSLIASSLTLTTPSTSAGDYLIMSVVAYNGAGNGVPTITTPAGWTSLGSNFIAGGTMDLRLAVFALAAPASPPASYAVSLSSVGVVAGTLTSYAHISGLDASANSTGNTATAVAPAIPAAAPNELLVSVFAHTGASSTPAGMTPSVAVAGTGVGIDQYHELRSAAGGTGTRSSGISGTNPSWVAFSVLLTGSGTGYDPTIDLSWTATPDTWATGYEIVRSGGPTTSVGGRNTVGWSDTITSATSGYTYTITAVYGTWRSSTRNVTVLSC